MWQKSVTLITFVHYNIFSVDQLKLAEQYSPDVKHEEIISTFQTDETKPEIYTQDTMQDEDSVSSQASTKIDSNKKKVAKKTVKKVVSKPTEEETPDFSSFAKKLKKTETIKRPIEEVKLETVELVHHELECTSKTTPEEMQTNVKIASEPFKDDRSKEDSKMKKKKKIEKTSKNVAEEKADIPRDKTPDETEEDTKKKEDLVKSKPELESEVILSEDTANKEGKTSSQIEKDVKMETFEKEKVMISDKEQEGTQKLKELEKAPVEECKPRKESEVRLHEETLLEKEESVDEQIKDDVKTTAKIKISEKEKMSVLDDEKSVPPKEMDKPLVTLAKKTPKKFSKPKEIVVEDLSGFAKKLRKTEIVKRPIEESKLEVVDLVHHAFESSPQEEEPEMQTAAKLTSEPLEDIPDEVEDDAPKKKKKKVITVKKKVVEKTEPATPIRKGVEEPVEELKTIKDLKPTPVKPKEEVAEKKIEENLEPAFAVKLKKSEVIKRPIDKPELEKVDLAHHEFENVPLDPAIEMNSSIITGTKIEKKTKKMKKSVKNSKDSSNPDTSTSDDESSISLKYDDLDSVKAEPESDLKSDTTPKKEPLKKSIKKALPVKPEEPEPSIPKLRKAPPRRPKDPTPERETVKLKHHDFESKPLDIPAEEKTGIQLNIPDEALPGKDKKVKKIKKKIPKEINPLIPQSDEDELVTEEVERKEKDPIVKPAAAITKKHADHEKVELPTFLNFPSEQGLSIVKDETPQELKNAPEFAEQAIETVEDDDTSSKSVKKSKPSVQISKTKKKARSEDDFRQIPITVLKSDMTDETVTDSEVV